MSIRNLHLKHLNNRVIRNVDREFVDDPLSRLSNFNYSIFVRAYSITNSHIDFGADIK